MTTPPAYAGDARATRTGTVSVTPASAAPGGAVTRRDTGCHAGRATIRPEAFADAVPLVRAAGGRTDGARIRPDALPDVLPGAHPRTVVCPVGTGRTAIPAGTTQAGTATTAAAPAAHLASTAHPASATQLVPAAHPASAVHPIPVIHLASAADPDAPAKASPSRELSSTSAVGLVLAGGAILVIAGQLLRLRLRLRRERQGDADEH
ncbi:hypothetical protein [Streptomyces sp. NPDC054786]